MQVLNELSDEQLESLLEELNQTLKDDEIILHNNITDESGITFQSQSQIQEIHTEIHTHKHVYVYYSESGQLVALPPFADSLDNSSLAQLVEMIEEAQPSTTPISTRFVIHLSICNFPHFLKVMDQKEQAFLVLFWSYVYLSIGKFPHFFLHFLCFIAAVMTQPSSIPSMAMACTHAEKLLMVTPLILSILLIPTILLLLLRWITRIAMKFAHLCW